MIFHLAPSAQSRKARRAAKEHWRVTALGLSAGALLVTSGCSGGAATSAASSHPPAAQAIRLAASQARQVSSLTESFTIQNYTVGSTTSGTMREQAQPTQVLDAANVTKAPGVSLPNQELLTSSAIYLRGSAQDVWGRVLLSQIKASSQLAVWPQFAETIEPLIQTRMLAAATNARAAGQQTIGGIGTTRYEGSYRPAAAIAELPASAAPMLGAYLKTLTSDVSFTIWIDAQHNVRKLQLNENTTSDRMTITLTVTSINQSVGNLIPPASRVSTIPASALESGGQ